MDPLSLALGGIGLGLNLFGGFSQASNAQRYARESSALAGNIADEERQSNLLKYEQQALQGRRSQLESIRNSQRARANAEAAAVSQGASQGSGLQGGYGQISGQLNNNLQNVNFGQYFSQQNYAQANQLSDLKMQQAQLQAQYQSDTATNQGIQQIGGAIMKVGSMVGPMFQGFGGGPIGTFSNGGNDGAAPRW